MLPLMDYPAEIRNLRRQIPKNEQDNFMREYKGLPKESKTQFKKLLREANLVKAGKLINRDLSGYKLESKEKEKKSADAPELTLNTVADAPMDNGFNERIKNILNSCQLDIDPQLLSEAAKSYETISGYNEMGIMDKTRKLLDVSQ
jgi:hypothetical protein